MKVLKFSGGSVKDAQTIRRAISIVQGQSQDKLWVVVSALEGATDELIAIANAAENRDDTYLARLARFEDRHRALLCELAVQDTAVAGDMYRLMEELGSLCDGIFSLGELSAKVHDRVLAFGELLSYQLFAAACCGSQLSATRNDSRDFLVTDARFGRAAVDFAETRKRIARIAADDALLRVSPGFVGRSTCGWVTTLGRDGADYTATIIGRAVDAGSVELWSNTTGVMTADPAHVSDATTIVTMTYEEAMELSHFGARVIHPAAMYPVAEAGIPLVMKNVFEPDAKGTTICSEGNTSQRLVTGISTIPHVAFVRVQGGGLVGARGVAGRLFTALGQAGINVIVISQGSSEHSICFAIMPQDVNMSVDAIHREMQSEIKSGVVTPASVETDMCVLGIVGNRMRKQPGIAAKVFSALGAAHINVIAIAQGSSELNISVVIPRKDARRSLQVLHSAFF